MKVRILGCGTSSGVPRIGNDWGDCDPDEPRNRRRRVSILVEHEGAIVLVDTGPDLREQLLDAGTARIDAVIWTHDHADHCHGIDDLRQVFHARGSAVPGFARPDTLDALLSRFGYIFDGEGGYPPVSIGKALPKASRSAHSPSGSSISRMAGSPQRVSASMLAAPLSLTPQT